MHSINGGFPGQVGRSPSQSFLGLYLQLGAPVCRGEASIWVIRVQALVACGLCYLAWHKSGSQESGINHLGGSNRFFPPRRALFFFFLNFWFDFKKILGLYGLVPKGYYAGIMLYSFYLPVPPPLGAGEC